MLRKFLDALAGLFSTGEARCSWQPAVIPLSPRAEIIAYWSAMVYRGPEGLHQVHNALDELDEMDDEDGEMMFR